jgi:hypothetical protein
MMGRDPAPSLPPPLLLLPGPPIAGGVLVLCEVGVIAGDGDVVADIVAVDSARVKLGCALVLEDRVPVFVVVPAEFSVVVLAAVVEEGEVVLAVACGTVARVFAVVVVDRDERPSGVDVDVSGPAITVSVMGMATAVVEVGLTAVEVTVKRTLCAVLVGQTCAREDQSQVAPASVQLGPTTVGAVVQLRSDQSHCIPQQSMFVPDKFLQA